MERLFRFMSLRRRRSPPRLASPSTAPPSALNKSTRSRPAPNTENERPPQWVEDEKKVREGRCSFQVKVCFQSFTEKLQTISLNELNELN